MKNWNGIKIIGDKKKYSNGSTWMAVKNCTAYDQNTNPAVEDDYSCVVEFHQV